MQLQLTGKQSIAGHWTAAGDNSHNFHSINPRTGTPGETAYHNATPDEISRAVESAAQAFDWLRHTSTEQRAAFLERVADEIEALGDDLLNVADAETGLGLPRLTGERGRTTGQLRKFAALIREGSYVDAIIDTAQPDRQPAPRPDIRRMLVPVGPVAVFTPNNFPLAFGAAGGDTASALAAGCPVIVKGHPSHPGTSELVAHAFNRAITALDFPAGTFSLVQGTEIAVGQALVNHPLLQAVAFTGSQRGGRAIFDAAAARPRPIPVYAEMGSINPVFILPDAIQTRGDAIAQGLAASVTLGSGQFCTNPGLVFVQVGEATDAFIAKVTELMHGAAPGVLLNEGVRQGLVSAVGQTAQKAGVNLLTGGAAVEGEGICYANTVMQTSAAAFMADAGLQAEHFGPVTLFVVCETADEMQNVIAHVEGNLTATIHAEESEHAATAALFDLLREKAGRLLLNGFPTGVEVVHAMQHGGPYPATTAPGTTSVGMTAIDRFLRPVAYQGLPDAMLPDALKDANPLGILRIVDDHYTREAVARP